MSSTTVEPVHYKGSCHCKKFEFEFEVPKITKAQSCNCSICRQKATVYIFTTIDGIKFTKGSIKEASSYQFGQKRYRHMFCSVCGCSAFGTDNDEKGVAINLRSVEGVDLNDVEVTEVDGASL